MPRFRYRAVTGGGASRSGVVEEDSRARALEHLRRAGLSPIEISETTAAERAGSAAKWRGETRRIVVNALSELAVLLGAGLTLDRALSVVGETITRPAVHAAFDTLHKRVKEGAPLSRAMAEAGDLFPPLAPAMAAAGEADGRLDVALARLGETLERNEALRQTIGAAMVYPVLLLVIAAAVILTMLLWVIPQFESLFDSAGAKLPTTTRVVMALSKATRAHGLLALAVLAIAGFAANIWRQQPAVRAGLDRWSLGLPLVGPLIVGADVARFSRALSSLVEGGVPLPDAVVVARGTLGNRHLGDAMARVAAALRQGVGLTTALTREPVFPRSALSFVRTGEETASLGPMLARLADVLDRDVRIGVERLIAVATPLITVVMGGIVATVIASIMTAILGFNDLALTQ